MRFAIETLPTDKGTYVLVLRLRVITHIQVGPLGAFEFPEGWYAYVGSAFGAGGLRGRLKHHLAPVCHPHWHIDYLRQAAAHEQVWLLASERSYEHTWAAALRNIPGVRIPAARFGASDCRCDSHLFHFKERPTQHWLALPEHPLSIDSILL